MRDEQFNILFGKKPPDEWPWVIIAVELAVLALIVWFYFMVAF